MSDNAFSRVYSNVFGGSGVQANLSRLAQSFQEGSRKGTDVMGCTWSGLSAIYDSLAGGGEVSIKGRRFRVLRKLGEGGYAFVFLVKEVGPEFSGTASPDDGGEGTFALKKFLIQSREQLQLVKQEIETCSKLRHPSLLPLLEHAIVPGADKNSREAFLLFPVFLEGTLQDHVMWLNDREPPPGHPDRLSPAQILSITKQVAAGLKFMHSLDPPLAHNDLKPGNVLMASQGAQSRGGIRVAVMDFGSAAPARKQIRSRGDALNLQEWAAQHSSAAYRAPEFWDTPSNCDIDERSDVWSLGCTVFALMYGRSPFESTVGEAGASTQLAVMSGNVKWPAPPPGRRQVYPPAMHDLVTWMLQTDPRQRPSIDQVMERVEAMLARLPPGM